MNILYNKPLESLQKHFLHVTSGYESYSIGKKKM